MGGRLFGWFGRKALLYLLLVAAIGLGTVARPWLGQILTGAGRAEMRATVLGEAVARVEADAKAAHERLRGRTTALRSSGLDAIDARIRVLRAEQDALAGTPTPSYWRLALGGSDAVAAAARTRMRALQVDQELAAARAARDLVASDSAASASQAVLRRQQFALRAAELRCDAATIRLAAKAARVPRLLRALSAEHRRLAAAKRSQCDAAAAARAQATTLSRAAQAGATARAALAARFDQLLAADATAPARRALAAEAARAATEWRGTLPAKFRLWAERVGLSALLWQAAFALLLITLTPFLIRLFCWSVLAPIAMRRPAIRLAVPGGAGAVPPLARSATSAAIRLGAGEELLVRQDYLQTTSLAGPKATRWLLDWRHPLSSIAAGLTFLTRIRGDGETTTVSAVRDPLAEVAVLDLPAGSACVLHPRALAAVAQPIARPLRVETRWRLGSLNAWLTLQLRFVIFHGPARLVVKGGRGVRIEPVERGRVFGQDQLVGFSADVAYSVTRTETFWPYVLGRESLLKDRVEGGEGVLIVEEAPLASRRGRTRHGLEGALDAALKVVGL